MQKRENYSIKREKTKSKHDPVQIKHRPEKESPSSYWRKDKISDFLAARIGKFLRKIAAECDWISGWNEVDVVAQKVFDQNAGKTYQSKKE